MPLLGAKLHVLNAIEKKPKKGSEIAPPHHEFVVAQTREVCSSAEEFNRKKTIYDAKIWTCRVTGRSNLTYKEATKSENASNNILKKSIAPHYRSAILESVHLNNLALEPLVHTCWTKLQEQYLVSEPILLKVDANKPMHATILEVDSSAAEPIVIDICNETSSPNQSDKENNSGPKRSPVIKKGYYYSIRLSSDEPVVVNHVPSDSIQRLHRPPSKDHIRMFIRANAMRYGPSSSGPWIVDLTALRRYCSNIKSTSYPVDRKKLRQLSETYEEKYYTRIMNERCRISNQNGEDGPKQSPQSLKRFKHFSVLREDNTQSPTQFKEKKEKSSSTKKKPSENTSGKKMKQATLPFGKPDDTSVDDSAKTMKPTVSEPTTPLAAKRLIRSIRDNARGLSIGVQIGRCAKLLTDKQIAELPPEVRDRVLERRSQYERRDMLNKMTVEEREAYFRDIRLKKREDTRRVVDENDSATEALPCPNKFPLPSGISDLQFGRILGFTEFIYSYQSMITEGIYSPGENFQPNRAKQVAADFCGSIDTGEEFKTDDEEEAALTSVDAGLPKASLKGLRRINLDRILSAISIEKMTAADYRCLARPMSALLRLVFRDRSIADITELGLILTKLPITPYTAPELFRLMLSHQIAGGISSIRDKAAERLQTTQDKYTATDPTTNIKCNFLGAVSLVRHLAASDVYSLDAEHRILLLELLVEWLLDIDLIDDYMCISRKRAFAALKDYSTATRQKRSQQTDSQDSEKPFEEPETVNGDSEADDLASIVKRRRLLAAQAATERERERERREKERERREQVAKLDQAVTRAHQDFWTAGLMARVARRLVPLGIDRQNRRYWRFFCAPHRLFVEDNWANADISYQVTAPSSGDSTSDHTNEKESTEAAFFSLPSPALFSELRPPCEAFARSLGFTAYSRWFVFDRAEQLDLLAEKLLDHGFREGPLKKALRQNATIENIKELLGYFSESSPQSTSGDAALAIGTSEETSKSSTQSAVDRVTAKCRGDARTILANVLLKNLYDTEIHLRDGGLGGVPDFFNWQLKFLAVQSQYGLACSVIEDVPLPNAASETPKDVDSGHRDLAEILTDVGLNVHQRYLKCPKLRSRKLMKCEGDDLEIVNAFRHSCETDTVGSCNGDHDDDGNEQGSVKDAIESDVDNWINAWRDEVNAATTISRLNLLHACLDACIVWEKSVEHARCRVCRRKSDDENLLLCDGCNQGFHLYCLRPPLTAIPPGDWFCVACKPPKTAKYSRSQRERRENGLQQRRAEAYSSDLGEEDDDDNNSDSGSDCATPDSSDEFGPSGARKTKVAKLIQSAAFRPRKPPNSTPQPQKQWTKSVSTSNMFLHDMACLVCNDAFGDLISCSACPNTFHPQCHNPKLRLANKQNNWVCSVCRVSGSKPNGSAVSQSLRPRSINRFTRRSSYLRLHQLPPSGSVKRPHQISEQGSATSSSEQSDNEGDEDDEDEETNSRTTVAAEDSDRSSSASSRRQPPRQPVSIGSSSVSEPPAKRSRTSEHSYPIFSLQDIISAVVRNKNSWPFRHPVDREEVPDYYDIIATPIDLSMIQTRLEDDVYKGSHGPEKMAKDFSQMFYNAELYNSAESEIWVAGSQLESYVQSLFCKLPNSVAYKREKLN